MTQPEQPTKPVFLRKGQPVPKVRSPLVWVILLVLPVILGFLVSMGREAPEEPALVAPAQAAVSLGAVQGSVGSGDPGDEATIVPETLQPRCDFAPWVGMPVNADILTAVKESGRAYRILKPGSAMTMDASPSRINFDIDERGLITRVWCG